VIFFRIKSTRQFCCLFIRCFP